MGVYDILPGGQQVKCWWCEGREVKVGDEVLPARGLESYSIALQEGGYANVFKCTLMSVTEVAMLPDIVDKWGGEEKITMDFNEICQDPLGPYVRGGSNFALKKGEEENGLW